VSDRSASIAVFTLSAAYRPLRCIGDPPTQWLLDGEQLVQEHQAELNRTLTQTSYSAAGIPVILVGRRLTLKALAKRDHLVEEEVTETIINGLSAPGGLIFDQFRPRSPL
jgi:hypothetical protein